LAKSGVLRGRRATTYHLLEGKRHAELAEMGAEVADTNTVRDRNTITSAAPATAIYIAFALPAELTTDENAKNILHMTGFATDGHGTLKRPL